MDKEYNTNFIDFDYASSCWRANKKYLGKGIFTYKCNHISKTTNKYCTNKRINRLYCKFHSKIENINK
jgi:hypothetical protein